MTGRILLKFFANIDLRQISGAALIVLLSLAPTLNANANSRDPSNWARKTLEDFARQYECGRPRFENGIIHDLPRARDPWLIALQHCVDKMDRLAREKGRDAIDAQDRLAVRELLQEFGPELDKREFNISMGPTLADNPPNEPEHIVRVRPDVHHFMQDGDELSVSVQPINDGPINVVPDAQSIRDDDRVFKPGSSSYIEVGGYLFGHKNDGDLPSFNQSIEEKPGFGGFVGAGLNIPNLFGPVDVTLGVRGQVERHNPDRLNNDNSSAYLNLGGDLMAYSILGDIGLEGPLHGRFGWRAAISGGLTYWDADITNGGNTVLWGDDWVSTITPRVGLTYWIDPTMLAALEAFYTHHGPFDLNASSTVKSKFDPEPYYGMSVSIRKRLGRTSRLSPGRATQQYRNVPQAFR